MREKMEEKKHLEDIESSKLDFKKYGLMHPEKSRFIFEQVMWLKSIDSIARPEYYSRILFPSSDHLTKDYFQEVKIINNILLRITTLCILILGEDKWNISRFAQYIENNLKSRSAIPELTSEEHSGLIFQKDYISLFDTLVEIRCISLDFLNMKKVSHTTFNSLCKIISREINKNQSLRVLKDINFNPPYDKITNEKITLIVKDIHPQSLRVDVAKIFLELFRLLHYLDFIILSENSVDLLKRSLPIFSLFRLEIDILFNFLNARFIEKERELPELVEAIDNFLFASKLELKKVYENELINASKFDQIDELYTRIDNSNGILTNHLKQWIVIITQSFKDELDGDEIFTDFRTRTQQSLRLRRDLWLLMRYSDLFEQKKTMDAYQTFKKQISKFERSSIRYLMYRDLKDFKMLVQNFENAENLKHLLVAAHKFSTYLSILFQQIGRRASLSGHPFQPGKSDEKE
jgi:hypothetical protein